MNWGYKILIVYIVFVAGILLLVFKSSSQNQDLVATDYYEQELKYQDRIDQSSRANRLSDTLRYDVQEKELVISFPPEMKGQNISANVLLYCIADKSKDVQHRYTISNAELRLPVSAANKGLHEIKISWEANAISYYNQHKILLQ